MAIGRASDYFGPGVLLSAMGERMIAPVLAGRRVRVLGNPEPFVVDHSRFVRAFGEDVPIQAAVRDTVAWLREHPPRS